jgi:phenylpyruvate tautomerase PptA (4-oxalocrotonate tautomerase family)
MALREFEPLVAKYYAKIPNSKEHSTKPVNFMCNALTPRETNRNSLLKGFITSATKRVIFTTNKEIDLVSGSMVEVLGKKLKITNVVIDETDANMLAAAKFKASVVQNKLPKWMILE